MPKIPSIGVFRSFGDPQFLSDFGRNTTSQIIDFISATSTNEIEELTKENIKEFILKRRSPILILWLNYSGDYRVPLEHLRRSATYFQREIAFTFADGFEYFSYLFIHQKSQ